MAETQMTLPVEASNLIPLSFDYDLPRVRDVDLGERLGMARPTNIRRVIERNKSEIERYGLVHAASAPIVSGKGRIKQVEGYWLNEKNRA